MDSKNVPETNQRLVCKKGGFDNGRIAAIAGLGVSRECYAGLTIRLNSE